MESDVLSITSLSEGFPQVILEAVSNNLPIISNSVGGISEFLPQSCISDGKNLSDFAFKLHKICNNKKFREKVIGINRRRLLKDYSFDVTSEKFGQLYRREIND